MRKIVFVNRKGGSGKTSIVVNVAYHLSQLKRKVLVIDLDSQGHTTFYFGANPARDTKCVHSVLKGSAKIGDLVMETEYKNLFLIPASPKTVELNEAIGDRMDFLKVALEEIEGEYDYVLFDLPPSLEKVVYSGMLAAKEVIIPLQTHFFPMQGVAQLVKLIFEINGLGGDLKLCGVIPTLYNNRTRIYRNVIKEIADTFGRDLILPGIPYDIKMAEAPGFRLPVALFAPESRSTSAFKVLIKKIIRMES